MIPYKQSTSSSELSSPWHLFKRLVGSPKASKTEESIITSITSPLNFSSTFRRHCSQMKASSFSEEIRYQSSRLNFLAGGFSELLVDGTRRGKYRYGTDASINARSDSQEKARDNLPLMMLDRGLRKYFLMTYRLLSFRFFSRKLTSSCAMRCSSRVRCACARSCWSSSSFTSFSSRITCICLPSRVVYNSWIASVFAAICLLIWIH